MQSAWKRYIIFHNKKKEFTEEFDQKYNYNEAFRRRVDYYTAREKYSIDQHTILYESYFGRGLICNPYALFLKFREDPRFRGFRHVWVLDELNQHAIDMEEYQNDSNVIFVESHSREYFKYLSCAKYLITNVTFQSYFIKKPGQIVINTWHGVPLKYLGFDTPRGNCETANSLRNFLMSDYILSANEFTSQNFRDAYKLQGLYEGKMIETGYPRNDTIYHTDRERFLEKLKKYGVDIDPKKKVVLYAPTWKGAEYSNPTLDVEGYKRFLDIVYTYVNPDEVQVLFKPHQVVYKTLRDKGMLESYYIPATIDTNELLSITDILVSDYSSIFFDFLVTDRPILFYIPDVETYTEQRGLYFDVKNLPGPIAKEPSQIGKWIADIEHYTDMFDYNNYTKAKSWAVKYDDGQVCDRVVDVLLGKDDAAIVHTDFSTDKIKLLINNDTMKTNGITTSLCNLLNNLDYNKYDVTLCAGGSSDKEHMDEAENNICNVNKNVRVYYRSTSYDGTKKELIQNALTLYFGVKSMKSIRQFPAAFYENEYLRCFTGTTFDYVINFSGYSNILSLIFASNRQAKRLIWMHNDMVAERQRFEDGTRRFNVLGTIYPLYDKLVSCAHSVMKVNQKNLEKPDTKEKFSYACNLISNERIEQCLKEDLWVEFHGKHYYGKAIEETPGGKKNISLIPGMDDNCISFVTMGRLSMEKNHKNLILAFAKLYAEHPNVRLFILGEGPLKNELKKLIAKNNLQGKVNLTGNLYNPFGFVTKCDCYIMPSLHEGQPMAILEARMLGMPIIVSNFSTVADSLYDNGQLLIDTSVDSIYDGMKAFLNGQVPNEFVFDIDAYNQKALREFETALQES